MSQAAARIPFNIAVDCGFEAVCFARNISTTGLYIEAPISESSKRVQAGMDVKLLISPLGSAPTAQIEGKITRVEEITLPDGQPGRGLGIQFLTLSPEIAATLERSIKVYLDRPRPEDIRQMGKLMFSQYEERTLGTDPVNEVIRRFIGRLDPRSIQRIRSTAEGSADNLVEQVWGQVLLAELGLRCMAATVFESGEKQVLRERLRAQVAILQQEFEVLMSQMSVSDHAKRKEIASASSRLSDVQREVFNTLEGTIVSKGLMAEQPRDKFAEAFLPEASYQAFIEKQHVPDGFRSMDIELARWLLEDWYRQVREHPSLPTAAENVLREARSLALKIGFEARRICDLKPFARNAASILPGYRSSAAAALEIQKKIGRLVEQAPRGEKRDDLLCLTRAADYLARTVREFERFTSSLPSTSLTAGRFYEDLHFRYPEAIEKAMAPRPQAPLSAALVLYGMALIAFGMLGATHWDFIWGKIIWFRGAGQGAEIGVRSYSVRRDIWVGKVDSDVWNQLPFETRYSKGNELATRLMSKGFHGVELKDSYGRMVALVVFRGRKPEWMVLTTSEEDRQVEEEMNRLLAEADTTPESAP